MWDFKLEPIKLSVSKSTKAIQWRYVPQPIDSELDIEVPFGGYFWQLPVTVPQANVLMMHRFLVNTYM